MTTISEADFRTEVTDFLEANTTRRAQETGFRWGEGSDDVGVFEEVDREAELVELAEAKAWRAKRYDAGLGWIGGAPP